MIKVIVVGKLKEKYFSDACSEYLKRLQKYTVIKIIEVSDYSDEIPDIAIKKENELIKRQINPKDYLIALDINGRDFTSLEFSEFINKTSIINSNITFIIGGSNGLSTDLKSECNYLISFSKLTFPHQLFRVMLLEQIYRSYKILNNEKYHK